MTRTVIRRAGLAIAVFLTLAGVGATFAAFSGTTSNSGNSFNSASTFLAFVRDVGSATCGSTSDTVTVPAGGVEAGDTLVVRATFGDRGTLNFATGASDSQGNVYQLDISDTQGRIKAQIFSAYIATALSPGDTIAVTHPDIDTNGVAVTEFRGVDATARVDQTSSAGANSDTPTSSVTTTHGNDLVVGYVSHEDLASVTQPGGWNPLPSVTADCGVPPPFTQSGIHGAYRIVSSTGTYTYDPTLSSIRSWVDELASYKG